MNSDDVKKLVFGFGADLCGIASTDRFGEAPEGYSPLDVMPKCNSVIAFACSFPVGTLTCENPVPYTRVRNSIAVKMDSIALEICMAMEKKGYLTVPIPSVDDETDERTGRTRSIVSIKHAAQAAGLGTIGRHSLLITPEYGSMVWLGCVLTEAKLEPDPLKEKVCNDCGLCVSACPVNALENVELNQDACWRNAFSTEKNNWRIRCHKCRDICPFNLGTLNSSLIH